MAQHAHVVHALPARVHVRAPALAGHPDACRRVAHALAADPAYARVSARPVTGSVVVEREDGPLDADAVASRLSEIVAAERDEHGDALVARPSGRDPGPTRVARAVAHAVTEINGDVSAALDHRADLGTLLPVAFAISGLAEVATTGKMPVPTWFNLLWWSLRSFMTFNVRAIESETDGKTEACEEEMEHELRVR